jgi:hypothetical protein
LDAQSIGRSASSHTFLNAPSSFNVIRVIGDVVQPYGVAVATKEILVLPDKDLKVIPFLTR